MQSDLEIQGHSLAQILTFVRIGSYGTARERLRRYTQQKLSVSSPVAEEEEALSDEEKSSRAEERDVFEELRVACLKAEIADYFGDTDEAWHALEPLSARIRSEIDHLAADPDNLREAFRERKMTRALLRQKLFFLWQLSCCLYHRASAASTPDDLSEPLKLMDLALGVAREMMPPIHGLLSQLLYGKARLLMRQRQYEESIALYQEALQNVQARLEHKIRRRYFQQTVQTKHPSADGIEQQAAQYSAGKIMALGIGTCYLEQGQLTQAHNAVFSGMLLLQLSQDDVHYSYASVILAEIERKLSHGRDISLQELAAERLKESIRFLSGKKKPLAFRARYQLAVLHMHKDSPADLRRAEEIARELENDTKEASRWRAMAWILQARIRRRAGDYASSYSLAKKAVTLDEWNESIALEARFAFIRTLIAESEDKKTDRRRSAKLREEAVSCLKRLLERVRISDTKARVFPLLMLAQVLHSQNKLLQARQAFEEYRSYEKTVQDPRIRDTAESIAELVLPETGKFVCPADEEQNFDLKINVLALKKYLYERCTGERSQASDALGIKKTSYFKLRKLAATKLPVRRRRKASKNNPAARSK